MEDLIKRILERIGGHKIRTMRIERDTKTEELKASMQGRYLGYSLCESIIMDEYNRYKQEQENENE